jgi:hypothetical protein
MYESDITRFLRELKRGNPQIEELQEKNRRTWWDRAQDLDVQRERSAANVPQPPYAYFPLPHAADGDAQDSGKKLSTPSSPA